MYCYIVACYDLASQYTMYLLLQVQCSATVAAYLTG